MGFFALKNMILLVSMFTFCFCMAAFGEFKDNELIQVLLLCIFSSAVIIFAEFYPSREFIPNKIN